MATTSLLYNAASKFGLTDRQIFSDIVEDLSTVMRSAAGPTTGRVGSFYSIANIFAVALTNFAKQTAIRSVDRMAITGIGSRLFASYVELGRAINSWQSTREIARHLQAIRKIEGGSLMATINAIIPRRLILVGGRRLLTVSNQSRRLPCRANVFIKALLA